MYMQNLKPLTSLWSWAGWFESTLVANPEDRFSREETRTIFFPFFALWETVTCLHVYFSHSMTKSTKWLVRPPKTLICPDWSETSLFAWRNFRSLATHWVHSKDADLTGRMPRLIWAFAGRTGHFVSFVMLQLNCLWYTSARCAVFIWSYSVNFR